MDLYGRNAITQMFTNSTAAAFVFPFTRPFIIKAITWTATVATASGAVTVARIDTGGVSTTVLTLATSTPNTDNRPTSISLVDATNNPAGAPFRVAAVSAAATPVDLSLAGIEQAAYTLKISFATAVVATTLLFLTLDGNFV